MLKPTTTADDAGDRVEMIDAVDNNRQSRGSVVGRRRRRRRC